MTQEERAALMQAHNTFANEALKRGLLTGGAPLQPTSTATTVRVRNGKTLITDGPFAETKEQLAGSYALNCEDLDEAIEMATKIPDTLIGSIEIRQVIDERSYPTSLPPCVPADSGSYTSHRQQIPDR